MFFKTSFPLHIASQCLGPGVPHLSEVGPHGTIVTISHPWQRDTGKYAAQGPNIMLPEGPMMLPEGRRAELEARGQHQARVLKSDRDERRK